MKTYFQRHSAVWLHKNLMKWNWRFKPINNECTVMQPINHSDYYRIFTELIWIDLDRFLVCNVYICNSCVKNSENSQKTNKNCWCFSFEISRIKRQKNTLNIIINRAHCFHNYIWFAITTEDRMYSEKYHKRCSQWQKQCKKSQAK